MSIWPECDKIGKRVLGGWDCSWSLWPGCEKSSGNVLGGERYVGGGEADEDYRID